MPRKVNREIVQEWRRLAAQGISYNEIGKATKWDQRTVSKHLKNDIRFSEPDTIRRELFKERLGIHWDRLVQESVELLGQTRAFDPWQYVDIVRSPDPGQFTIAGATVTTDAKWKVAVKVDAREQRVCQLLQQHMPGDILWENVRDWESAVFNDFSTRRRLYLAVERHLGKVSPWPLIQGPDTGQRPALLQGATDQIYEVSLCLAADIADREIPFKSYREDDNGRIEGGSRALALAEGPTIGQGEGLRKRVYELVTKAARELAASSEAAAAAGTYQGVQSITSVLRRTIEDLRLLPYLAGVCDVCYRFTE